MNTAVIYRARSRGLVWLAFGCAITIHLTAIALAKSKSQVFSPVVCPFGSEVEVTYFPPSEPPAETVFTPDQVQPATDEDTFPEENAKTPIRPRKQMPVTSVVRSTGIGNARAMHAGSVKALTLYAPRPNYPYEARRGGVTGSGVVRLTVNSETGNVIEARMAQSTGSSVLDNTTVETLRRWRFKPGVASNVDVPITYTLMGVSY